MISKKSLVAILDKSIILTITAPNDNANQDPVQCAPHLVHVVIEWPLMQNITLVFNQVFNRKTVAVRLLFLSLDYVIDLYLDLQYVMLADEKEVYTKMHHKHTAEHQQFTMGFWNS